MRRLGVAVLWAALLVFGLPAVSAAAVIESFKAEDWDGLAFTNDTTGEFSHCAVFATYQNGSTLYLSSEVSGGWFLSFANPKWSLTSNSQYPLQLRVDSGNAIDGTSAALGNAQLGLPIPGNHPFIAQLRRGARLTVIFQGAEYAFQLSNSSKAMKAAEDCVAKHRQAQSESAAALDAKVQPGAAPQQVQQQPQQGQQQPAPAQVQPTQAAQPPSGPVDHHRPSAATGERQTFGSWVVTATSASNGDFVNCTAFGVYGSDQLILSLFPDGVWTFGLYRTTWQLNTNESYFLWYNVDAPADGAGVIKRPVEAAEPKRIFFEVSELEDIIARMGAGSQLNIQVRGLSSPPESYSFALSEAGNAFEATRQCVANRPAPNAPQAQAPATQPQVPARAPVAEAPAEAPAAVASVEPTQAQIPRLGAKTLEKIAVPGWTAAAFSLADGTFTHCAIRADYQNGATLGVARAANGDLVLSVKHKDWSLKPGDRVPLNYAMAGSNPISASTQGEVVPGNLILANIGSDSAATAALHDTPQVNVEAEGMALSFDTRDIGPGVEAIDACVARHGGSPKPG